MPVHLAGEAGCEFENELFYYWPLLRKNNMATNLQRLTSSCGDRCFAACDCWTQASWQVIQRDSYSW